MKVVYRNYIQRPGSPNADLVESGQQCQKQQKSKQRKKKLSSLSKISKESLQFFKSEISVF